MLLFPDQLLHYLALNWSLQSTRAHFNCITIFSLFFFLCSTKCTAWDTIGDTCKCLMLFHKPHFQVIFFLLSRISFPAWGFRACKFKRWHNPISLVRSRFVQSVSYIRTKTLVCKYVPLSTYRLAVLVASATASATDFAACDSGSGVVFFFSATGMLLCLSSVIWTSEITLSYSVTTYLVTVYFCSTWTHHRIE